MGEVDGWIAREFAPHRLNETIHDLAAVPLRGAATSTSEDEESARKIAECDRKLAGYRAPRRRRPRRQGRSLPPARTQADLPPWEETRGSKRATRTFGFFDGVRGVTRTLTYTINIALTGEFSIPACGAR
jgi:hypothetical protein